MIRRIVVAGGTGFLGRPLTAALAAGGCEVVSLSRQAPPAARPGAVWTGTPGVTLACWSGTDDLSGWGQVVEASDAVVNLAGAPIAQRWTEVYKRQIRESRVLGTRGLARAVHAAAQPPRAFISSSAVGYYGSRGETRLVEASAPGDDFLARVGVDWEAEARRAATDRTAVVCVRTGVVLGRHGGALEKMLLPFKLFAGGPAGSGVQYMSWIHLADWVALVQWLLDRQEEGPFNATAPEPVTNAEFAAALGRALRRPSWFAAPPFALRLALGEMADALLLGGQRVFPQRALELGFQFRFPTLDSALADLTS